MQCKGVSSGGSRGGARPPHPLFWVKKEEMTEGKMAGRAIKSRPPPPPHPLRSRSESATGQYLVQDDIPDRIT